MSHDWHVAEASEAALCRLAERRALRSSRPAIRSRVQASLAPARPRSRALDPRAFGRCGGRRCRARRSRWCRPTTHRGYRLAHLDLYRLSGEDETAELGIEDYMRDGALLVEWPERAPGVLGPDRLDIRLSMGSAPETRNIHLGASGSWGPRLERIEAIADFLSRLPAWTEAHAQYLQGDASARAYARLEAGGSCAVLMDQPRQPDGRRSAAGCLTAASRIWPRTCVRSWPSRACSRMRASAPGNLRRRSRPRVSAARGLRRARLRPRDYKWAPRRRSYGAQQSKPWSTLSAVPVPDAIPLADGSTYRLPRRTKACSPSRPSYCPTGIGRRSKGAPIPDDARAEFTVALGPNHCASSSPCQQAWRCATITRLT